MTDDRACEAILAAARLFGETDKSSFTDFFDKDTPQSVLLLIEKLSRNSSLIKNRGLIRPSGVMADMSALFNLREPEKMHSFSLGREYIKAVENIILSRRASLREAGTQRFLTTSAHREVFPAVRESLFIMTRAFLRKSDVFFVSDSTISLNRETEKSILLMDSLSLACSVLDCFGEEEHSLFLGDLISFFKRFSTDRKGLERLIKLLCIKYRMKTDPDDLVSEILNVNLLIEKERFFNLNLSYIEEPKVSENIICDSDFTVRYSGERSAEDKIYLFCDLRRFDTVIEYEVTKSSFFRGLDEGMSFSEIIEILGKPSFSRTIDSWQESYERIGVYKGYVLQCTPLLSAVIQTVPELSRYVVRKITDTVFLMSTEKYEIWSQKLAQAMDVGALPKTVEESLNSEKTVKSPKVALKDYKSLYSSGEKSVLRLSEDNSSFEKALSSIPGHASSGMDYRAKLSLIRDALKKENSILLMEMPDKTIIAKPIDTRRQQGNDYLMIRNIVDGKDDLIKISTVYSVKSVEITL